MQINNFKNHPPLIIPDEVPKSKVPHPPKYFRTMTELNQFKKDQDSFKKLIFAVQVNNKQIIKASLDEFCSDNYATSREKIKAVLNSAIIATNRIYFANQDLAYVFSLICERFGKYDDAASYARQAANLTHNPQRADQLFERSIALYQQVKNPQISQVIAEQLLKCGRFKVVFEKLDAFNPDLIKYTLLDRISHKSYYQYKLKHGMNFIAVTEPYLTKSSQPEGAINEIHNILGVGLSYAVIERRNRASKLAIKSLGSMKEVLFSQMPLDEINQLYFNIKKSPYAINLNFPLRNHKGVLQRVVRGISLDKFLLLKLSERNDYLRDNLIPATAVKQFQVALHFLNKNLKFYHKDFQYSNIMLDTENKCFTLIGFSFIVDQLGLFANDNRFMYNPEELGFTVPDHNNILS